MHVNIDSNSITGFEYLEEKCVHITLCGCSPCKDSRTRFWLHKSVFDIIDNCATGCEHFTQAKGM